MLGLVTYSTISDYSEDVTKRKGNIRTLTKALLLGQQELHHRLGAAAHGPRERRVAVPPADRVQVRPQGQEFRCIKVILFGPAPGWNASTDSKVGLKAGTLDAVESLVSF